MLVGKDEETLNKEVFQIKSPHQNNINIDLLAAKELFDIDKHWHKRIVRCGENTLYPYKENPPNKVIQDNDILFFDFGPIIENWEADLGRTYVIGNDPMKLKLKKDIETERAWQFSN